MALIINPATYSPVSAEIWLSANSAGSSAYGFKYVYNVKKYDMITGVSASLGEYDVPPRPTTGYGIFSPAKLVRSQLTYNLQPFIILPTTALNSITQFNVEYGTLYNPNIKIYEQDKSDTPYNQNIEIDKLKKKQQLDYIKYKKKQQYNIDKSKTKYKNVKYGGTYNYKSLYMSNKYLYYKLSNILDK